MNDTLSWGSFRRLKPISDCWGMDRGRPIDRFYIENFLANHAEDIRGRVLEIENPGYTKRFGDTRVATADVLDIDPGNKKATIVADLSSDKGIPERTFDCFILTQTLQLIFEVEEAVKNCFRLLKPGGVLLATVPGITPIPKRDAASKLWCWSFTGHSIRRLFARSFGKDRVAVGSFGNVLSATSFLWGLSQTDLTEAELKFQDSDYPVVITIRAVRQ